jgi:hypothetical protein
MAAIWRPILANWLTATDLLLTEPDQISSLKERQSNGRFVDTAKPCSGTALFGAVRVRQLIHK